jgi:hypothetical protein
VGLTSLTGLAARRCELPRDEVVIVYGASFWPTLSRVDLGARRRTCIRQRQLIMLVFSALLRLHPRIYPLLPPARTRVRCRPALLTFVNFTSGDNSPRRLAGGARGRAHTFADRPAMDPGPAGFGSRQPRGTHRRSSNLLAARPLAGRTFPHARARVRPLSGSPGHGPRSGTVPVTPFVHLPKKASDDGVWICGFAPGR